tara:strand:- start:93 stop:575 length:483 start_codon:yes stop_codon:yes gene_type:complete
MTNIRIGIGYDVHQLQSGLPFILGGVKLESDKGIVAHSDGDILYHSIADALLGAAALGDIGKFFPDNNPKYKNMDSKVILLDVVSRLKKMSYSIVNIDVTIVLERPKLNPFIPKIKSSVSNCLSIDLDQLNIKATTSERMGFVGEEKGVACYSVVLIEKI